MLVAKFQSLPCKDVGAVGETQDTPSVKGIEIHLPAPREKMARQVHPLDLETGTGSHKAVEQGQCQRDPFPVLDHGGQKRILVVVVIGRISVKAERSIQECRDDGNGILLIKSEPGA